MAFPKRDEVKDIVEKALASVADFKGDIERFTFAQFHDFHKHVFLNRIVAGLAERGRFTVLNDSSLDRFSNIGELIDYIVTHNAKIKGPRDRIELSEEEDAKKKEGGK